MKFTRMFILKAINNKYYECLEESRENLMLAIKDLIICNNHLDHHINRWGSYKNILCHYLIFIFNFIKESKEPFYYHIKVNIHYIIVSDK